MEGQRRGYSGDTPSGYQAGGREGRCGHEGGGDGRVVWLVKSMESRVQSGGTRVFEKSLEEENQTW